MPSRVPSTSPASRSCFRWWLTVASVTPTAGARSQVQQPSSDARTSDISRTRTGSARALSRRATCRASASDIAPAAMGEQQTGAVTSRTGRALGTSSTYIELDEHQIVREPLRHPSKKEHLMSRVQLALNVDDLEASIAFYSKLFNAQPHKVK